MTIIKPILFEISVALPLLFVISYLGVILLEKQISILSRAKVAAILTAIFIFVLATGRAAAVLSYKYAIPTQTQQAGPTDAVQLKNGFLQMLDRFAQDPTQVTPANIKKLFEDFSALFPNGEKDKKIYYENLFTFMDCDQSYFEDALKALQTKKNQKSEKRAKCQQLDGIFFNRKLMIPEETARVNDQVIETIANGKKIIQDGKEVEINEGVLKQNIEAHERSKDVLKVIFSEGT